jgi:hypothetical protein
LNFSGTKEENEFSICITDESGFIFYSANTKGEKFSKQFLLDTDDLGGATLNFQITGRRSGKTVVYRVSRQAKEVSYQMDIVKL